MTEIYPAQFIRIDLFPANATLGTEVWSPVRVIVTDSHAYVFKDSPTGPTAVYTGVLEALSGDAKSGYVAEIEDGQQLLFKRSSGCGCGSRLRGFRPFPGIPHVAL